MLNANMAGTLLAKASVMRATWLLLSFLAGCGADEPQIGVELHAAAISGEPAGSIEVALSFRVVRDTDSSWGNENLEPVFADCSVFADGQLVVQKVDTSESTAQLAGYPREIEVVIAERDGARHRATTMLPALFTVDVSPQFPVEGNARVDWTPSGDDRVNVGIDLVHQDEHQSSWAAGEVDDGTEALGIGGPLNEVRVSRSMSESIDGIGITAGLSITTPARPPAAEGDVCDSDDDCAPLACDWVVGRCRAPAATGAPCTVDDQCASGLCNWETHRCAEPAADGTPCLRDDECASELCLWKASICGAPLPPGSECVRDRECKSTVCDAFVCL